MYFLVSTFIEVLIFLLNNAKKSKICKRALISFASANIILGKLNLFLVSRMRKI